MKLKIFRTLWGVTDTADGAKAESPFLDTEAAIAEVARLGYDGLECPLKFILHFGKEKFKSLMKKYNLDVIVMIFTDGPVVPGSPVPVFGGPYPGFSEPSNPGENDKDLLVRRHLQIFKEQVECAQEFNPKFVNCHSLKDYFTFEMAESFFTQALAWQKETGFKVRHETHRKRFLHSPWVARSFVPKFPELKMVADLSHWINIAETDSNDPDLVSVIEKFAPQFGHTHCRVGYDHGPQVPDPRCGQWLEYMEGHERWWDAIWAAAKANGDEEVTMTPEHGPPNYQVCDPKTNKPLANIWDVNHWIALRRRKRFAQLYGEENTAKVVPSPTQGFEPETNPGKSVLTGKTNVGFQ